MGLGAIQNVIIGIVNNKNISSSRREIIGDFFDEVIGGYGIDIGEKAKVYPFHDQTEKDKHYKREHFDYNCVQTMNHFKVNDEIELILDLSQKENDKGLFKMCIKWY